MQALSYFLPVLQAIHDIWRKGNCEAAQEEPQSLGAQLVAYINRHLFELKGLNQLEDAFYMSASQINRIFRSFTGSSVWHYVKIKRLFAARELIKNGMTPHKAASACSYQDYSTFFRAYKNQFGNCPQEDLNK
jgi:AraC-like DNA-binding protein